MGYGVIHHAPLWAQDDVKLSDAFYYQFILDSVWDAMLYVGDRMTYKEQVKLDQYHWEILIVNPVGNPCGFGGEGGTFESYSMMVSWLLMGYPYYKANNKKRDEDVPYTGEAENPNIEIVQFWAWLDMGNACCKRVVCTEDDWFSSLSGMLVTPYSSLGIHIDWPSLIAGEKPFIPTRHYPIGRWLQLDYQAIQETIVYSMYGECGGGGLFGGLGVSGLLGQEVEYERVFTTRLRWQWDYYEIATNSFYTEDEAQRDVAAGEDWWSRW